MKVELVTEVVKVVEGGKQDDWLRPSLRLVWRMAYPIHVRAAAAAAAGGLVPGSLSYRSGTLCQKLPLLWRQSGAWQLSSGPAAVIFRAHMTSSAIYLLVIAMSCTVPLEFRLVESPTASSWPSPSGSARGERHPPRACQDSQWMQDLLARSLLSSLVEVWGHGTDGNLEEDQILSMSNFSPCFTVTVSLAQQLQTRSVLLYHV